LRDSYEVGVGLRVGVASKDLADFIIGEMERL